MSFDLFFESLPLRGAPISPERAWHEVADVLEPLTLSILFWDAAIASWWLFARDHTQEEEIAAVLAIPGGWQLTAVVHLAWIGEEDETQDGEDGEEEDDPDAEDPEHQGHQSPDTMSVFGSSLGDPEEEAEMVEVTVEVEDDPSLESELAAEEVD